MNRNAFFACFFLLVALGLGCAITNYDLITDNDQVANGQGSGIVNTNGKAKITPSYQFATRWPDGTDEGFAMVDQKANGDRVISNYNNYTTGTGPIFLDDMYCNPDWSGCAYITAQDPEVGDVDRFDYVANPNCSGARSLLGWNISTGRYYGECGRAAMTVSDRIALMNLGTIQARQGVEGLLYHLNRNNMTIRLNNNAGIVSTLAGIGDADVFVNVGNRQIEIDATNSLLSGMGNRLADWVRDYGTEVTTVTLTYNGISRSWDLGHMDSEKILRTVRERY